MACFLCADDVPPLHKMCKCDVLVHQECFRAMVTRVRSHETSCPVCTTPYPMRQTTRTVVDYNVTCVAYILVISLALCIVLVSMATLLLSTHCDGCNIFAVIYTPAFCFSILGVHAIHKCRFGEWCPVVWQKRVRSIIVDLPKATASSTTELHVHVPEDSL